MVKQRKWSMVILPLIFAAGIVGGVWIGKYMFVSTRSAHEDKLRTILEMIDNEYVDEVNMDSLMEELYPRLLELLDPHSAYIPASELQAVNDDLEGSFSGVGVSFQIMNDTVTIIEVVAGGPSEKVGLQAGDKILRADTVDLTGKGATNENVFKNLRGKKGSKVTLEILRSTSAKPLKYDIVRGDVPVHSVDAMYALDDKTGYIRVSKFARTTAEEFHNALLTLKLQGVEKFIVDLRGNSGGFMDQAILMAEEFLKEGQAIVYTKGKLPEYGSIAVADDDGAFSDSELVVLTDEYSASASEIFAGAIQDNDRGLVVGRRTFGKGLVQTQTTLPDSSAIRLTIARYYTPSGRSIQKDYKLGGISEYESDIAQRFKRGEFYNMDSIKLDKSKMFNTMHGRTVYGGGGIMPDVFVPEDTLGMTSYYVQVVNAGLIQKYAYKVADNYREVLKNAKTLDQFKRLLPRDNTLLEGFVEYAAANGVPARWYYIRKSQNLILSQLKGVIARDILGYSSFIEMLNEEDPVVKRGLELLRNGQSPVLIVPSEKTDGKKAAVPTTKPTTTSKKK
ncbi:MAG: S41 family peptidase [Bacteroidales bacterium]|nr:S41 family peptidase [Bacteroidales bacterium]